VLAPVSSDGILRSAARLIAVAPLGETDGAPKQFEWQALEGAARYRVRLLGVDRIEIWHTDTAQTRVSIPASIQPQMLPGRTFLWEITGYNKAEVQLGTTDLQSFHILMTR